MDCAFLFRCIMEMLMRDRLGFSLPLWGRGRGLLVEEGGARLERGEAWWWRTKLLASCACVLLLLPLPLPAAASCCGRCGCLGLASWSNLDMETALPVLGVDDLGDDARWWTPERAMACVMVGTRSVRRRAALGAAAGEYIDWVMAESSPARRQAVGKFGKRDHHDDGMKMNGGSGEMCGTTEWRNYTTSSLPNEDGLATSTQ